jgi:hypothetical protein
VKVFYEPDPLKEHLAGEGWDAEVFGTSRFIYGWASPGS